MADEQMKGRVAAASLAGGTIGYGLASAQLGERRHRMKVSLKAGRHEAAAFGAAAQAARPSAGETAARRAAYENVRSAPAGAPRRKAMGEMARAFPTASGQEAAGFSAKAAAARARTQQLAGAAKKLPRSPKLLTTGSASSYAGLFEEMAGRIPRPTRAGKLVLAGAAIGAGVGAVMSKAADPLFDPGLLGSLEELAAHPGGRPMAESLGLSLERARRPEVSFMGIPVTIENPTGSTRSGTGPSGRRWSTVMLHDYGEIPGTLGLDGDPVDAFLGPDQGSRTAFVITTRKPPLFQDTDEQKVMLGFGDEAAARGGFLAHYDDPRYLGEIQPVPTHQLHRQLFADPNQPTLLKGVGVLADGKVSQDRAEEQSIRSLSGNMGAAAGGVLGLHYSQGIANKWGAKVGRRTAAVSRLALRQAGMNSASFRGPVGNLLGSNAAGTLVSRQSRALGIGAKLATVAATRLGASVVGSIAGDAAGDLGSGYAWARARKKEMSSGTREMTGVGMLAGGMAGMAAQTATEARRRLRYRPKSKMALGILAGGLAGAAAESLVDARYQHARSSVLRGGAEAPLGKALFGMWDQPKFPQVKPWGFEDPRRGYGTALAPSTTTPDAPKAPASQTVNSDGTASGSTMLPAGESSALTRQRQRIKDQWKADNGQGGLVGSLFRSHAAGDLRKAVEQPGPSELAGQGLGLAAGTVAGAALGAERYVNGHRSLRAALRRVMRRTSGSTRPWTKMMIPGAVVSAVGGASLGSMAGGHAFGHAGYRVDQVMGKRAPGQPLSDEERQQRVEAAKARWEKHRAAGGGQPQAQERTRFATAEHARAPWTAERLGLAPGMKSPAWMRQYRTEEDWSDEERPEKPFRIEDPSTARRPERREGVKIDEAEARAAVERHIATRGVRRYDEHQPKERSPSAPRPRRAAPAQAPATDPAAPPANGGRNYHWTKRTPQKPDGMSDEDYLDLGQQAVALTNGMRSWSITKGRRRKGQIPEGTDEATERLAFNHARNLALHDVGLIHYDWAHTDEAKEKLKPLQGYITKARREMNTRLRDGFPGAWAPFRQQFGTAGATAGGARAGFAHGQEEDADRKAFYRHHVLIKRWGGGLGAAA